MNQSDAQHLLKELFSSAVSSQTTVQHTLLSGENDLTRKVLLAVTSQVQGHVFLRPSISTLDRGGDMAAVLTHLRDGSFLILDDIHRLSKSPREVLTDAIDRFVLRLEVHNSSGKKTVELPFPRFTLIGVTSRPYLLPDKFRQLLKHQIQIEDRPTRPTS
jgi:Holliday junction DNA helicase RuvB